MIPNTHYGLIIYGVTNDLYTMTPLKTSSLPVIPRPKGLPVSNCIKNILIQQKQLASTPHLNLAQSKLVPLPPILSCLEIIIFQ